MNSDVNVGHVKIPSKYQELDVKAGKGDGEGSLCMCVSFYCNIKFTPDLSNLKPNSSLSQFLWVRNPGAAQTGRGDSWCLKRLQSPVGLTKARELTFKMAPLHCCQDASFLCHMDFSIGLIEWSYNMAATLPQKQLSQRASEAEIVMFFMT